VPFVDRNTDGLTPWQVARRRSGHVYAAARRRPGGDAQLDVESSPFFTAITGDAEGALAKIAGATGVSAHVLREHPNVLIGPVDAVVDVLQSRRDDLLVNYVTVQQSQIDAFAPVVARLHGL
jgi:hypothetical protein